ncbi:protein abrupt-like isoform X1 [Chrysoperla carnea]|uniref:protein abrupt-like isoform X1 n=1 Tax=Chrysoperla carnea TaxID=189513 RepID=UPI001D0821E5|nr:protein abrupt-like isoform X1 [Chrysoperla carnea]
MAGEQFSLSWNEFHKNLSVGFINLFEDSSLVDVTLAVDGRKIQAHKVVLSVCSPYFKELFNENPCQHPIVFLKDVNFSILQNLLKFMYQGEVNVSQEELADFIKTAEELQIKGLTGTGNNDTGQSPRYIPPKYKQEFNPYHPYNNSNRHNNRMVNPNRYKPLLPNNSNLPRRTLPSMFHRNLNKGTKFQVVNTPPEIKRQCADVSNLELRNQQQLQQQQLQELRNQQQQRNNERNEDQQSNEPTPTHTPTPTPTLTNNDASSNEDMVVNVKPEPQDYDMDDIPVKNDDSFPADETFEDSMDEPQAGTSMDVKVEGQDAVSQDEVYFIRSLRGTPMLVVGDYTFSRNKRTKSRTYWVCCKSETSKCKVSCIIQDNGIIRMPRGQVHNHPNDFEKIINSEIMNVSYHDISAIFTHQ